MSQRITIECKPNGPYVVKNLEDLEDSQGEPIPCKPVLALCRCGGSANKPFCVGTHNTNGFSVERLADGSADVRDTYATASISIHDNRSVCAHAGHCTDGLWLVNRRLRNRGAIPSSRPVESGVADCAAGRARCTGSLASAGFVSANWRTRG